MRVSPYQTDNIREKGIVLQSMEKRREMVGGGGGAMGIRLYIDKLTKQKYLRTRSDTCGWLNDTGS